MQHHQVTICTNNSCLFGCPNHYHDNTCILVHHTLIVKKKPKADRSDLENATLNRPINKQTKKRAQRSSRAASALEVCHLD